MFQRLWSVFFYYGLVCKVAEYRAGWMAGRVMDGACGRGVASWQVVCDLVWLGGNDCRRETPVIWLAGDFYVNHEKNVCTLECQK